MELKSAAEIVSSGGTATPIPETRGERLLRWAEALERLGPARLHTLWRTEFALREARAGLRTENSPLSAAYADPVLRIAGLADDSYAEAKRFFQLTDYELHWVVCYCHYGETLSAEAAARQVRALAQRPAGGGWFARVFLGRAA